MNQGTGCRGIVSVSGTDVRDPLLSPAHCPSPYLHVKETVPCSIYATHTDRKALSQLIFGRRVYTNAPIALIGVPGIGRRDDAGNSLV